MLASPAFSFLSGFIEVFQQPDKPPTCGSHGPRSLSSYVALQQEAGRARKKAMLAYLLHVFFNYLASF